MIALHRSQIPPAKIPSFAQTMQRCLSIWHLPERKRTASVSLLSHRGARIALLPRESDPSRCHPKEGEIEGEESDGTSKSARTDTGKAASGARSRHHRRREGEDDLLSRDGGARRRVRDEGPDGAVHQGVAPLRRDRWGEAAGARVRASPDGEGIRGDPGRHAADGGARGGGARGAGPGPRTDVVREVRRDHPRRGERGGPPRAARREGGPRADRGEAFERPPDPVGAERARRGDPRRPPGERGPQRQASLRPGDRGGEGDRLLKRGTKRELPAERPQERGLRSWLAVR